jgi:hypothetical protein
MAKKIPAKEKEDKGFMPMSYNSPIWEMGISELEGRSLEKSSRDDVNKMLAEGWVLLHVYTLKYREDNIWRERPMAILGKPKAVNQPNS